MPPNLRTRILMILSGLFILAGLALSPVQPVLAAGVVVWTRKNN